jgi:hypothetical protein
LIAFRAGERVAFAFGDGLFEHVFDLAVGEADIDFSNPNGIETFSPAPSTVPWQAILIAITQPRIARNELSWVKRQKNHNPERVESDSQGFDIQPFQGC